MLEYTIYLHGGNIDLLLAGFMAVCAIVSVVCFFVTVMADWTGLIFVK